MAAALLLMGTMAFSAPATWTNADWNYRAQVSALSPDERANALVEWDVDFSDLIARAGAQGTLDPNSPRVTMLQNGQEKEMPCRFFAEKDNPAKGRLCWLRVGTMPAGSADSCLVYFDVGASKSAKVYPEMARAKPVMAKNLLANGDLVAPDKADATRPDGWLYGPASDVGSVEWIKGAGRSGKPAFKVTEAAGGETAVVASCQVAVQPNTRYSLSGWAKADKGSTDGYVLLQAWFSTADGKAVSSPDGDYGNYKLSASSIVVKGESPWTFVYGTSINVYDPKSKSNHAIDDQKTLPGTGAASIQAGTCYGKCVGLLSDMEFRECPNGLPMGIWVTAVEKKP